MEPCKLQSWNEPQCRKDFIQVWIAVRQLSWDTHESRPAAIDRGQQLHNRRGIQFTMLDRMWSSGAVLGYRSKSCVPEPWRTEHDGFVSERTAQRNLRCCAEAGERISSVAPNRNETETPLLTDELSLLAERTKAYEILRNFRNEGSQSVERMETHDRQAKSGKTSTSQEAGQEVNRSMYGESAGNGS